MSDNDIHDWRRDEEDGLEASKREFEPRREPSEPQPATPAQAYAPAHVAPGPAGVRAQAISCPNCQYNLTGATIGMACPECGMIVGGGLLGANNMPASGKAVASLVLGIVSILGCMFYGIPAMICGPLALIFARQAKGQAQRGEVNPSSENMAMAGFVCGLIGTIMGAVVLVIIVGFIAIAILSSP